MSWQIIITMKDLNDLKNVFVMNVEIIVRHNCKSDLQTFRSTEVVTRRIDKVQEEI